MTATVTDDGSAMPVQPVIPGVSDAGLGRTDAAPAKIIPMQDARRRGRGGGPRRPELEITNELIAIRALADMLPSRRAFPDVYVRGGALCRLGQEDAEGTSRGYTRPVPEPLTPDGLRATFSRRLDTFKVDKDGKPSPAPVMRGTCATLLGYGEWPGVPTLRGIVTSPVMRPDGTLLQRPGFDSLTGLYYHQRFKLAEIPERPDSDAVTWARKLIADVFCDFPFVSRSDRAQFIGSLFAPIIRPYAPGPTPFIVITATAAGSGKTLLKDVYGYVFGGEDVTWVPDEPELRKRITAKLIEGGAPVLAFDNVPSGHAIKSATLASLLTARAWSDRILGVSKSVNVPNDRLWVATGNNLKTGGDIARRAVWVRLDPDCPDPGARDGFTVGDLGPWLELHAPDLLTALLVLTADWSAAGMPAIRHRVADYSTWFSAIAGLLDHAGIPGFLEDRSAVALAMDEEISEWAALLERIHAVRGERYWSVREIMVTEGIVDLIPRERDDLPSAKKFGKWLSARAGAYFGAFKLVGEFDKHSKVWTYAVRRDPGAAPTTG